MKKLFALLFAIYPAVAQTDVYVRAGAPAAQTITGATNATPIVIQTAAPHGFSSSCNTTTNICYCGPTGVPTGTGPSPANGVRECVYVDATHLALYDLSGNPVAGTGNWWNGYTPYGGLNPAAQWVGQLTKYTIPANPGPLGYLDGTNGDLTRRVSLGPQNGLSSLVVTGCPSACVITITASYNLSTGKFPVAAGQHFSISGTWTSLDTCGDGTAASGPQSPYTVATATTSTIISTPFACSTPNQDYTNINLRCGPAATPNDTIGGTQSCTRVSQMAYTGNSAWDNLVNLMSLYNFTSSPNYKTTFDGGAQLPQNGTIALYGMAAVRFLVDPTNSLWLNEMLYGLNNDQRTGGVGYAYNSAAWISESDGLYNYTDDVEGLTLCYAVASPYWTASEKAAFLNRTYNDSDDPSATACVTTNQDAANPSTHNWVLSSGLLATGTNDATHAQLPATDPHYSTVDYYKNTVIMLSNGQANDYTHATYGLITGQTSGGVLTVSGWSNGNGNGIGSGAAPALDNVISGTYTSGLTCTGSTGQTVALVLPGGTGYTEVLVSLTGTNTIASGTPLTVLSPGKGWASGPTTGNLDGNLGSATRYCTGTATVATSIGTPYTIFDTVTISSGAAGASATVTFTKTASLSGKINPGDGILGYNGWGSNFTPAYYMSYVSSVGSNTLSVINAGHVTASGTPTMAWRFPQWTTGDCGRLRASKSQVSNSLGVQAVVYGPGVGASLNPTNNVITDVIANGGGANSTSWMIFELVTAPDDPRAVRDLARTEGAMFDYGVRPLIDFSTGRLRDGPGYSLDQDTPSGDFFVWGMTNSIPSYPTLDVTGPWMQNVAVWDMFETLPDSQDGNPNLMGWGGMGYQSYILDRNGVTSYGLAFNSVSEFAPASNKAAWFKNFQEHVGPQNLWGYTESIRQALSFLHNDPRVADSDYTVQPHQFAFNVSSPVTSLTGWPQLYRGDAVISRTGWSSRNDTLAFFDSATYSGNASIYDSPRVGQLSIWKTGCLLGADSNPCNAMWGQDPSTLSDTFGFAGAGGEQFNNGSGPPYGYSPLTRWASANAGTYGSQYGDSASRYAAACTDATANYNQARVSISIDHVQICWADLKKPGNDQFIFQFHDAALTTGTTAMQWHLHYPQNGTAQAGSVTMPTGSTTYMGSNVIKSVQDGGGSTVPRTHGLMTYVTSPGTITLRDDCSGHAGGQCAPGDTYSGGSGYSHRFTIAGGASVGTPVSQFASVVVHKVMSNLSDTTLTTLNLNPDANWTGVQACGSVSCAVFLGARRGTMYSAVTPFTTTHSGTAQYLVTGLTPGTYNVTVGGSPVLTGTVVSAGDNSLYFESTAGAVTISRTGVPPSITTASLPASTAGIAYSQVLAAVGGATPYTWSVSSGSLPHNLTLGSSTGVIGGIPDTAGTSAFTVTVTGADTLSASTPLSVVINPALAVTTAILPAGAMSAAYSQALVASGGTGAHTWSISAGALPGGLQIDSNSGVISGTPAAAGAFNFTVLATDSVGASSSQMLSIVVQRPAGVTVHGITLRGVTAH